MLAACKICHWILQNSRLDSRYCSTFDTKFELDKKEFEAKQFTDFKDQFQWFLAAALFLLLADVFLLERKTKWLEKLNLFNEDGGH